MTIGRVTSNVELYSQLRTDVNPHGRTQGRLPPPSSENGNVGARHSRQSAALSLDVEDRQRSRHWREEDGGVVVPFEQPTELVDQQPEYGDTAQEVPLALEVGNGVRDPFLAQAAQLYARNGRPTFGRDSAMIGTQLDAVA